jgi:formylglycine-generating enzyme required for sulfatase activity
MERSAADKDVRYAPFRQDHPFARQRILARRCRRLHRVGGKTEERQGRSWRDPGYSQTGSHPVACINFGDAEAYIEWLSAKTGKTYRLLTTQRGEKHNHLVFW